MLVLLMKYHMAAMLSKAIFDVYGDSNRFDTVIMQMVSDQIDLGMNSIILQFFDTVPVEAVATNEQAIAYATTMIEAIDPTEFMGYIFKARDEGAKVPDNLIQFPVVDPN